MPRVGLAFRWLGFPKAGFVFLRVLEHEVATYDGDGQGGVELLGE